VYLIRENGFFSINKLNSWNFRPYTYIFNFDKSIGSFSQHTGREGGEHALPADFTPPSSVPLPQSILCRLYTNIIYIYNNYAIIVIIIKEKVTKIGGRRATFLPQRRRNARAIFILAAVPSNVYYFFYFRTVGEIRNGQKTNSFLNTYFYLWFSHNSSDDALR